MKSSVLIERVIAIETSCDDTSVALVQQNGFVEAVVSANQDLAHQPFGGVVPEIASRNHTLTLLPLIDELFKKSGKSWSDVQGICVTNRPGLIGSLIVGIVTAKALAQVKNLPLIGINHLEGHLLAPFLRDKEYSPSFSLQFPYLALAISGGHTSLYVAHEFGKYEVIGSTLDDAAGEAFDKFGKMIGLGFPGGVKVDQLSKTGNADAFSFPRAMIQEENFMLSFSGLKASAARMLQTMSADEIEKNKADLCASFQQAIVDVLLAKLDRAVKFTGIKKVIITGGVSANSRLRDDSEKWAARKKIQIAIPPLRYCTDNAAMIGYVGILKMNLGLRSGMDLGPSPDSLTSDFFGVPAR